MLRKTQSWFHNFQCIVKRSFTHLSNNLLSSINIAWNIFAGYLFGILNRFPIKLEILKVVKIWIALCRCLPADSYYILSLIELFFIRCRAQGTLKTRLLFSISAPCRVWYTCVLSCLNAWNLPTATRQIVFLCDVERILT